VEEAVDWSDDTEAEDLGDEEDYGRAAVRVSGWFEWG
jgi:hypothetical protein